MKFIFSAKSNYIIKENKEIEVKKNIEKIPA